MACITSTIGPRAQRILLALLLAGSLAASAAALAGCSQPEEEAEPTLDQEAALPIETTISVVDGDEVLLPPVTTEMAIESTALEQLQASGLDVEVTDSQYGAYVTAINGLAADATHGWTYAVNGEEPAMSAETYVLQDGDEVVWSYVSYEAA